MVKLSSSCREVSPCKGCTERFEACWGRCPKEARGEPGYATYRAKVDEVNEARRKYKEKPYVKNHGIGG